MTDDPREKAALDLKVARADAIHNYAALEQSLASLLAALLKISNDEAGIVFFNIVASRSRDKILKDLLERRFGDQYDRYWYGISGVSGTKNTPGLFALIEQLATTRNYIVHWSIAVNIGDDPIVETLTPPNIWGFKYDQRSLSVQDLEEFSAKASFASRSVVSFTTRLFHQRSQTYANDAAWKEIFQQPCTFPPSNTHPLAPKP